MVTRLEDLIVRWDMVKKGIDGGWSEKKAGEC